MIGRRKAKKMLRAAAAELLMVANELATRPRGLAVSSEEARELANRIRQIAGDVADVAVLAYDLKEEEE